MCREDQVVPDERGISKKILFTEHHIIPRSRSYRKNPLPLGYEKGDLEEKFADLVDGRNEIEAVTWLVEQCWNGDWDPVRDVLVLKDGGFLPEFSYEEKKVKLDHEVYKKYHRVFKNLIPREIVVFLVVYLWNWGWHYLEEALKSAS